LNQQARAATVAPRAVLFGEQWHMDQRADLPGILVAAFRGAMMFCLVVVPMGCRNHPQYETETDLPMPQREIHAVLRDHDRELMANPGVVGVFQGLLDDDKTPCLKVMVVRKTPELELKIPKSIEGYPVVVEETGPIRPLQTR
jgi:hypothetical protein